MVCYVSFCEAADRRGLIKTDNTLNECLIESEQVAMTTSLRRLFATILLFYEPGDVRSLWDRQLETMSDNYRHEYTCSHDEEPWNGMAFPWTIGLLFQ
jgi:hypothetical protein